VTSFWGVSVRHPVCAWMRSLCEQYSSLARSDQCVATLLSKCFIMSGRIVAPRIASSRSLLWRGRSSTAESLLPRTTTARAVVAAGGACSGGGLANATSPLPAFPGRFFSEQAYTPGIGVGKTSTGYVRALSQTICERFFLDWVRLLIDTTATRTLHCLVAGNRADVVQRGAAWLLAFSSYTLFSHSTASIHSAQQVGLEVEPDWYNVMLTKFQGLLDRLEASDMPETAQYRADVTKWCQYVIEQVKANPNDPEAVEDAVNMGQVEELIEMADDEMVAMDVYLKARMWELVEQSGAPSVEFNPDPMKDPFAADGDPAVAEKLRQGLEAMKQEKKG
jgi:ETC complex I subunit conserved region